MKFDTLIEAMYKPKFDAQKTDTSRGQIRGSIADWLKAMKLTKEDLVAARDAVHQTKEYQKLIRLGLRDVSTKRHEANGSYSFKPPQGLSWEWAGETITAKPERITVLANGKLDHTAPNGFHRRPLTSPKPHIVAGNPQKTILSILRASFNLIAEKMSSRLEEDITTLEEYLKSAKEGLTEGYMLKTTYKNEKFSPEVIAAALAKVRKSAIYKHILVYASDVSTKTQLKNGSLSFAMDGTNGYYVTATGNIRYYGDLKGTQVGTAKDDKFHKQGRIAPKAEIHEINTDDDEKEVVTALVKRFTILLRSLHETMMRKAEKLKD